MNPSPAAAHTRAHPPTWLTVGHWLLLSTMLGCLAAFAGLGLQAWQAKGPASWILPGRTSHRAESAAPITAMVDGAVTLPGAGRGAAPDDGATTDAGQAGDLASDRRAAPPAVAASGGIFGNGLDLVQPGAGPSTPAMRDDGYDPAVLEKLATELRQRRDEVEARSRALDAKAAAMALVEGRLNMQVGKLEALRKDLAGVLDTIGKDEEARLGQLVKVYEAMKAKQAAPIFDAMDIELLLRIVRRMRDAKVAAVVAEMNPDKARILTTRLAAPPVLPTIQ